jgi:uncharacterized protein (DUF488 family)
MRGVTMRVFTVGHSTHPGEDFVGMLRAHGVREVVDVRTVARSRHNPQFGEDQLEVSLPQHGIGYGRLASLGGLRRPQQDSPNGAWRNASFRGYADYMQTEGFLRGLAELVDRGSRAVVAVMCAEAVPWRCHRSLIGDALVVRGVEVLDIMSEKAAKPHTLTPFAQVEGQRLTYPPVLAALPDGSRAREQGRSAGWGGAGR